MVKSRIIEFCVSFRMLTKKTIHLITGIWPYARYQPTTPHSNTPHHQRQSRTCIRRELATPSHARRVLRPAEPLPTLLTTLLVTVPTGLGMRWRTALTVGRLCDRLPSSTIGAYSAHNGAAPSTPGSCTSTRGRICDGAAHALFIRPPASRIFRIAIFSIHPGARLARAPTIC